MAIGKCLSVSTSTVVDSLNTSSSFFSQKSNIKEQSARGSRDRASNCVTFQTFFPNIFFWHNMQFQVLKISPMRDEKRRRFQKIISRAIELSGVWSASANSHFSANDCNTSPLHQRQTHSNTSCFVAFHIKINILRKYILAIHLSFLLFFVLWQPCRDFKSNLIFTILL